MVKLAIVSPCYNEQDLLSQSSKKLLSVLDKLIKDKKISKNSFIVFVNDGSNDNSWEIIKSLHNKDSRVKGINLSYNSGHQNALMAGMLSVENKCDCAVTIDCDLQDDINAIQDMVDKFSKGCDVVYGVKTNRSADSFFKRTSAKIYYKFLKLLGIKTVYNHADFRLVSNKVIHTLSLYKESALYLRGIIASFNYRSDYVEDKIAPRLVGESRYTKKKMFKLACDGVTSFSSRPLKIIFIIGLIFVLVAIINGIDLVVSLINNSSTPGWSQLMLSIWFIGGICLLSIGILGIYLGRIFSEVKNRPRFIVSEKIE